MQYFCSTKMQSMNPFKCLASVLATPNSCSTGTVTKSEYRQLTRVETRQIAGYTPSSKAALGLRPPLDNATLLPLTHYPLAFRPKRAGLVYGSRLLASNSLLSLCLQGPEEFYTCAMSRDLVCTGVYRIRQVRR